MHFNKILFIASKSILVMDDPAFNFCIRMAKKNNSHIEVLLVIDETDIPGYGVFSEEKSKYITDEVITGSYKRLEIQLPDTKILSTGVKVRFGINFIEIIKESIEGNYDLIIKSQDSAFNSLHSIDLHLLRKTQVPLWIVRNQGAVASNTVAAAIDLDLEQDDDTGTINDSVISLAKSLAISLGWRVKVVSCWKVNGEDSFRNIPFFKLNNIELSEIMSLEENKYKELMKNFLAKHNLYEYSLLRGETAESISNFINLTQPNVLVMGTFSRTGIKGYLIGNTAEDVMLSVNGSIATIKLPEFISPVV